MLPQALVGHVPQTVASVRLCVPVGLLAGRVHELGRGHALVVDVLGHGLREAAVRFHLRLH